MKPEIEAAFAAGLKAELEKQGNTADDILATVGTGVQHLGIPGQGTATPGQFQQHLQDYNQFEHAYGPNIATKAIDTAFSPIRFVTNSAVDVGKNIANREWAPAVGNTAIGAAKIFGGTRLAPYAVGRVGGAIAPKAMATIGNKLMNPLGTQIAKGTASAVAQGGIKSLVPSLSTATMVGVPAYEYLAPGSQLNRAKDLMNQMSDPKAMIKEHMPEIEEAFKETHPEYAGMMDIAKNPQVKDIISLLTGKMGLGAYAGRHPAISALTALLGGGAGIYGLSKLMGGGSEEERGSGQAPVVINMGGQQGYQNPQARMAFPNFSQYRNAPTDQYA